METPEFLRQWGLGILAVLAIGVLIPRSVFDYEISAHATLTASIIDLYNEHYPSLRIVDEFRFDLIRGSKEEDNDSRSLNHFYDPVHNRGLTWQGKSWRSSKQWAVDNSAQKPDIYTWSAGIEAYAKGDKRKAFLTLGHILHLLEDASVPEHTRNDAHPVNSPYEDFTKTLTAVSDRKKPIILSDLNEYFDAMAKYSNNNFYSADTINGKEYTQPKPDYIQQEGKYRYGFKIDESGNSYHLVRYATAEKYPGINKKIKSFLRGDDNKILSDYWRLLSAKTVRYGAGLTHLFLEQGEQARRAYDEAEQNQNAVSRKSLLGTIATAFTFGGADGEDEEEEEEDEDGLREVAVVQVGAVARTVKRAKTAVDSPPARGLGEVADGRRISRSRTSSIKESSLVKTSARVPPAATAAQEEKPRACAYEKSAAPLHAPVIINEVAWMGTRASSNDEWIELKNISASAVDISGWQLMSERKRIHIIFPSGAQISAGGFYLLERGDDASVPFVKADLIYKGSISNSNDGVRLFARDCVVSDEARAAPTWPAGISAERRAMERSRDLSWHDYSGAGMSGVFGTPRLENNEPWAVKPGSSTTVIAGSGTVNSSVGSSSGSVNSGSALAPAAAHAPPAAPTPPPQSVSAGAVLINEFLFDAEGSDEDKEFIELYNATDQTIDLSSWSIQTQSSKKNFEEGNRIAGKQCFLVWLGDAPLGISAGLLWKSGSLNNTAGTLYVVSNQEAVKNDADHTIIDRVAYHKDALPGFAAGKSAERTGSGGLHARAVVSPGDCSRQSSATGTAPQTAVSSAGGFLKHIYFYGHPVHGGALVDFYWDNYPFMPGRADAWKALVLYLNSLPSTEEFLHLPGGWTPKSPAAASFTYPIYAQNTFPVRKSVIFPDTRAQMGSGGLSGGVGGLDLVAFNFDRLSEDAMARVTMREKLNVGDYITIGYYNFFDSGGGDQVLRLVSVDPTRYYFEKPAPVFKPAVFSGDVTGLFDAKNSIMKLQFPLFTDADSEDRILTQDLTINGNAADSNWMWPDHYSFFVVPGDDTTAHYRVRDDFNVNSAPNIFSWKYPGSVEWLVVQDRADGWSQYIGQKNPNCPSCPDTASFQSVLFEQETETNVFVVRLKSNYGAMSASARLTVYPDFVGAPDFTAPLQSQTVTPSENTSLKITNDVAFVFKEPVVFAKNKIYWLALDVASYFDPSSFYQPYLSNALFSEGDAYGVGVSGKGANGMCGSWCAFSSKVPSASSDWYFKIGWREP